MNGPIEATITPTNHDLGDFEVRRALPSKKRRMVGPFIFVDEFGPAHLPPGGGMDVRPHPHINLATVTWLFAGEHAGAIEHRDSLGTFCTIEPGTVNLMTAGSGIVHSERSPEDLRTGGAALFGMQTWLALPDGKEEIDPAFEAVDALPVVEDCGARATIIMGELWGERAPTTTYAETIYAEIVLAPGAQLPIETPADERALMVIEGEASLDGEEMPKYALIVIKPGDVPALRSEKGGRVMLLGGESFANPRHVWWNFVSSDEDRIQQAKEDWSAGRFPKVPGDEEEWIPLPDKPKTVTYP